MRPPSCVPALAVVLLVSLPGCLRSHSHEPKPKPKPSAAAPLPPPPPPPITTASGAPAPEPVAEIVEVLGLSHPDLLVSLASMGERATSAARAPARDPVRAESFHRNLDGHEVLAELTTRLSTDDTASIASVRTWLNSGEGKAFAAARKYAVEVRKQRNNLAGPSIERRNAGRRLVVALGDGRFHGLTDFSVLTQAFLGVGAPGKITGDFHKRLIEQGPWILERAAEIGTATEPWTLTQIESVISFWDSPAGKSYVGAIDRHLTQTIDARIAQAEGVPPPAP